jgi:hypothetical protein
MPMPSKSSEAQAQASAKPQGPDTQPAKPVPLTPEQQRQVGGGDLAPRPLPKGGW